MRLAPVPLLVALALVVGCGGDEEGARPSGPAASPAAGSAPGREGARGAGPGRPAAARLPDPAICRRLRVAVTGRVRDPALDELSGLVRSRTRPGLLWSHNDSGDAPVLYALRADGRLVGRVAVTGAAAVDWEDVAAAPGPEGRPFVYLGDIGDNDRRRATVDVYRVPEPRPGDGATAPAERLRLRYPDGAHDAETLLVDPRRGDLVIVTKAAGGARAYATSARRPVTDAVVTLRRGPRIVLALLTAGDVSADGSVVAVRGYGQVAAWPRRAGESLAAALRRPPCISPTGLLEGQGEALALDRRGTSFLTVAEGTPAVLRRYGPVPPG